MIEIEILLTFVYFLECTVVQCKDAHSVHQNSVEIVWAEIYRGRLLIRAEIYWESLLTLITEVVPDYCASDFLQI